MSVKLDKVLTLRLRPGDVLVLRVDKAYSADTVNFAMGRLQEIFPNNRVAVLGPGQDLEIVRQEST